MATTVYCDKKFKFMEYGNRTRKAFRESSEETRNWYIRRLESQGLIPVVVNYGGELLGVFKNKEETRGIGNRIKLIADRIKSAIGRRIHRTGN